MDSLLDRPVLSYVTQQFTMVEGSADVASAVKRMQALKVETIIVTRYGSLEGIVTDADILDKVVFKGEDSTKVNLRSIMSTPIISLGPQETVKQALGMMRRYKIKRLLVIEEGRVLGVVTQKILTNEIKSSFVDRTFKTYGAAIREHYKPILGNLGLLMQFAGILMIVPAIVGTALGEAISATGMYLAIITLFSSGFVLNNYGNKSPLDLKQASVLVIASFILLGFFGSIPYMYLNPFYPGIPADVLIVNSFFESVSGFTTTGMSTIMNPENLPQSFVFYRSYTQWIGGLSFIYLVIRLFYPEEKLAVMKGIFGGNILRFRQLLITISGIFTAYTVILVLLLYPLGETDLIVNVSVIFSSVTGGGFSPSSTFVAPGNWSPLFIVGAGMVISALPFAFHYSIFNKNLRLKNLGAEVLIYFMILVTTTLVFLGVSDQTLFTSAFHVVSASSNAGFQYLDVRFIPAEAKLTLIAVMLIGGTAFSTAGGIKVGRLFLIYQKIMNKRFSETPSSSVSAFGAGGVRNQVRRVRVSLDNGKQFKAWSEILFDKEFRESLLVIALFISVPIASGYSLTLLNSGVSLENAVFEAVSALTTTGMTTGMVTMTSDLTTKMILLANMVAGRFEIIAILYIFFSSLRR